jgi:hypothetical protein
VPEDTWEIEQSILGSIPVDKFWQEFKGGRSALKINDARKSSEEKIRKLFESVHAVERIFALSGLIQGKGKKNISARPGPPTWRR